MTVGVSAARYLSLLPALLLVLVVNPSAQTKITPDKNSYSVADDISLGQHAVAEAKKQLPMLNDDRVDAFVENVGAHLAAAIPSELPRGLPLYLRRGQPAGDQRLAARREPAQHYWRRAGV